MQRGPDKNRIPLAAAITAALAVPAGHAVSLNPDGLGQALIYPYYTVRSVGGNAFHTYLSVTNSTGDAKALRVRIREGRNAREALAFNLYLGANDVWTGALAPTADGAQLLTADASCTDPTFTNGAIALRREAFSGSQADGQGDTLDRTREGFVEILEMATLTGASAAAVTHTNAGVPVNCAAIRASATPSVAPPTGGLYGNLTLINVNAGQDFTLDATALADLASRPYFRPPSDPYPDFAAAEIDPVSVVTRKGMNPSSLPPNTSILNTNFLYRSVWSRPQDAVSAVLMSYAWTAEYTLDPEAASATDLVLTLPTRHFYVTGVGSTPPFGAPSAGSPACGAQASSNRFGERLARIAFNREAQGPVSLGIDLPLLPDPSRTGSICAASGVASMRPTGSLPDIASSNVLGSTTLGLAADDGRWTARGAAGWIVIAATGEGATVTGLGSLPTSVRVNLDTGETLTGRHTFFGLPALGFVVRTFNNGQLSCAGATCQGTYGSAFPMGQYRFVH
jgi:hypothetical protein